LLLRLQQRALGVEHREKVTDTIAVALASQDQRPAGMLDLEFQQRPALLFESRPGLSGPLIFGSAPFIPDSFHGKLTQPLWITLARLGKGDDMFGDN